MIREYREVGKELALVQTSPPRYLETTLGMHMASCRHPKFGNSIPTVYIQVIAHASGV